MACFLIPRWFVAAIVLGALWLPQKSCAQNSDAASPGLSSGTAIDAERDKIWNSPEMVEARAHLELTFKRSAKISDEQAAKYMADLKSKSPDDMQVWLFQYQEQRAQVQREEARAAGLRRNATRANLPAPSGASFRNPIAATGRPVSANPRPSSSGGNVQRTQRPFSGPQFSGANQPMVTSQDMARFEILRGPRPW